MGSTLPAGHVIVLAFDHVHLDGALHGEDAELLSTDVGFDWSPIVGHRYVSKLEHAKNESSPSQFGVYLGKLVNMRFGHVYTQRRTKTGLSVLL